MYALIMLYAPITSMYQANAHVVKKGLMVKYLPAYAPALNLIEILWRFMKYYWLPFSAYTSFQCLSAAVEEILTRIGTDYTINFKQRRICKTLCPPT